MGRLLIGVILLVAMADGASARDIYVNNLEGDDHHNGAAPNTRLQGAGPCKTIYKALRLAEKGDRIIISNTGQPYKEAISLQGGRHSGYIDQPFTIVGNGAVLDGTTEVPVEDWQSMGQGLFRVRPAGLSYQQLFLDDRPAARRKLTPSGSLPKLAPRQWYMHAGHIYFRVEKGKIPLDYHLSYSSLSVGITLYDVRNVLIEDLVIQGYQLDGINAVDNAFEVSLVGMNCRGNGRCGISIGGASRVSIGASLIGNNGTAQVRTEGWSHTKIINCDLLANTAPAVVREGGEVLVVKGPQQQAK